MLKAWQDMTAEDLQETSAELGGGDAFLDAVAPLKEACFTSLADQMFASSDPAAQGAARQWLAWLALPIHGPDKRPITGFRFNRATYPPLAAFCVLRYGEAPNATHDDKSQGWQTPFTAEDVIRFGTLRAGKQRPWPTVGWTPLYGSRKD